MVCWAWGAGWYCALPAWLASMTQLQQILDAIPVRPQVNRARGQTAFGRGRNVLQQCRLAESAGCMESSGLTRLNSRERVGDLPLPVQH
jgi:hypothetical protein